jgi:hypothetical protein
MVVIVMSRSVLLRVRRTPLARKASSPPRNVVSSGSVMDGEPVILPVTTISLAPAPIASANSSAVLT